MSYGTNPDPKFPCKMGSVAVKPPIGIKPHEVWVEERVCDLIAAINRYMEVEKEVPIVWLEEYNALIKKL